MYAWSIHKIDIRVTRDMTNYKPTTPIPPIAAASAIHNKLLFDGGFGDSDCFWVGASDENVECLVAFR